MRFSLLFRIENRKREGDRIFSCTAHAHDNKCYHCIFFFLQQNGLSHFDELVPRSQDDLFGTLERDANEEI